MVENIYQKCYFIRLYIMNTYMPMKDLASLIFWASLFNQNIGSMSKVFK